MLPSNEIHTYIHSSWGDLALNSEGYVLPFESKYNSNLEEDRGKMINGGDALGDIVRFDLQEFRHTYPLEDPRHIDICDIGYWTATENYEPPSDIFRKEIDRGGKDTLKAMIEENSSEVENTLKNNDSLSEWRGKVAKGETMLGYYQWLEVGNVPTLTGAQLERQDWVDNGIQGLLEEFAGKEVDWDIVDIGIIRDAFKEVIVDAKEIMTEQEFYPFI
ncbi:MAG: hypothetical protein WC291_05655 [Thermodesulfovibrionales bacterium]|jgi:hypothetical protein